MMKRNNNEDLWLHQMMKVHRKELDVNIAKRKDDFTQKVMNQLSDKEATRDPLLGTNYFWNSLLYICLVTLIGIAWINGSISSSFADGTWFTSLLFRIKQILNMLLQINPTSTLNLNKGILLLTSLPWIKYIVLVSVMLSVALFEWRCPTCLKKDKHCF